jgi:hypothetical protein
MRRLGKKSSPLLAVGDEWREVEAGNCFIAKLFLTAAAVIISLIIYLLWGSG